MIAADALSAVNEDCAPGRVWQHDENKRSTEVLTRHCKDIACTSDKELVMFFIAEETIKY